MTEVKIALAFRHPHSRRQYVRQEAHFSLLAMAIPFIFTLRRLGYQVGCGVLLLAVVLAIFGIISPGWYAVEYKNNERPGFYTRLWIECKHQLSQCDSINYDTFEGFEKAAQAFVIMGLLALIAACGVALYLNFFTQEKAHNRLLEIVTTGGGASIFLGAIIFVGGGNKYVLNNGLNPSYSFGYALALTFVAAILAIISGCLLFFYNRPVLSEFDATSLSALHQADPVNQLERDLDQHESDEGGFTSSPRSAPTQLSAAPPEYSSYMATHSPPYHSTPSQQPIQRQVSRERQYKNNPRRRFDEERFHDVVGDLGKPTPAHGLAVIPLAHHSASSQPQHPSDAPRTNSAQGRQPVEMQFNGRQKRLPSSSNAYLPERPQQASRQFSGAVETQGQSRKSNTNSQESTHSPTPAIPRYSAFLYDRYGLSDALHEQSREVYDHLGGQQDSSLDEQYDYERLNPASLSSSASDFAAARVQHPPPRQQWQLASSNGATTESRLHPSEASGGNSYERYGEPPPPYQPSEV